MTRLFVTVLLGYANKTYYIFTARSSNTKLFEAVIIPRKGVQFHKIPSHKFHHFSIIFAEHNCNLGVRANFLSELLSFIFHRVYRYTVHLNGQPQVNSLLISDCNRCVARTKRLAYRNPSSITLQAFRSFLHGSLSQRTM